MFVVFGKFFLGLSKILRIVVKMVKQIKSMVGIFIISGVLIYKCYVKKWSKCFVLNHDAFRMLGA